MLVLIDESGDTGFKQGSSPYFVMSLIVFPVCEEGRYLDAERASFAIQQIRTESGHKPEFHFSQCSHRVRQIFFNGLNEWDCKFDVYALVIDKSKIHSPHLRSNTKNFYNFILKQLLAKNPIRQANVKIDGEKSKDFKRELKTYLRRDQDGMIAKLKFASSKNDELIQLADMCCSAIAYKYSRADRSESDSYMRLLRARLKNVWEFK